MISRNEDSIPSAKRCVVKCRATNASIESCVSRDCGGCIRLCDWSNVAAARRKRMEIISLFYKDLDVGAMQRQRLQQKAFSNLLRDKEISTRGGRRTVYTDHKPIVYAFGQKPEKCTPRQFRYLDYMSQFTTDIKHVSGKNNEIVDAFSRVETASLDYEQLAQSQSADEELKHFLTASGTSLQLKKVKLVGNEVYCQLTRASLFKQPNTGDKRMIWSIISRTQM